MQQITRIYCKLDYNWDTRDHQSTDLQVKILHLILIKGTLSWRFCCILVKTAQLFDKETFFLISNALEIHRQVKTSDIMFRRFGDVMMPFSRNE